MSEELDALGLDAAQVRVWYRHVAAQRRRADRPCVVCGTVMAAVTVRRKYCSRTCEDRAYQAAKRAKRSSDE